jgi:hypothetical protein
LVVRVRPLLGVESANTVFCRVRKLLNLIANLASIAGLLASIAAWCAASGARKAASEARKAVRHLEVAERLISLGNRATELLACVEGNDTVGASLRGRDLTSELVRARLRWERFLSTESKNALAGAVAQVQDISLHLATRGIPDTPQGKNRLLRFCHAVNESLNAESGRMLAEIESKEE